MNGFINPIRSSIQEKSNERVDRSFPQINFILLQDKVMDLSRYVINIGQDHIQSTYEQMNW